MYVLTNAIKNLLRNRSRNLLIAIVTLVIIVAVVVTLIINNTATAIIEDAKFDIGTKVDIAVDLVAMYGSSESYDPLTINQYQDYANSEYLRETIYNAEVPAYSYETTAVDDEDRSAGTFDTNDGTQRNMPTMTLVGTSGPEYLPFFGSERELIEGQMFENENECIVSSELAALNDLSLGDTIELENVLLPDNVYKLTVVGIYDDQTSPYGDFTYQIMPYINKRNQVITSFDTVMIMGYETDSGVDIKFEYHLAHPDYLDEFEAEVRVKGLPDAYNVSINQAAYDKMVGPMQGLKSVSVTFMIVILVLGSATLLLVSFMAVRERKYEVGVLRAMGMEKEKVALGFLTEAVIITAVCLSIGLGLGGAVAQPVASGILDSQVAAAEAAGNPAGNKFLMKGGQTQIGDGSGDVTPINEIDVSLSAEMLTQIILIALSIAAITSLMGIVMITKYEPIKILMERN